MQPFLHLSEAGCLNTEKLVCISIGVRYHYGLLELDGQSLPPDLHLILSHFMSLRLGQPVLKLFAKPKAEEFGVLLFKMLNQHIMLRIQYFFLVSAISILYFTTETI
jgi:hypothetical protein